MTDELQPLVLDLLEWIGRGPRPYTEVMDAWRTSCPRLPVWEEANERGLVERRVIAGRGSCVVVTANGAALLERHRSVLPGKLDCAPARPAVAVLW
ncbi:MAG: hypothetical protein ABL907_12985 [Hyphomicrobium sp.]